MTRKYDESHITGFTRDLEKIQAKPTLYIGPTDDAGVFTLLRECMDNAVDEARAGRNDFVSIRVDGPQGPFWVMDDGVGIPVGIHKKMKISTLTHVLTNLQSSGKMQVDGAYKSAVGTHGVGIKATNALSSEFEVWTHRKDAGGWYHTAFKKGHETQAVKKVKASPISSKKAGTIIKFTPDTKFFGKSKINLKAVAQWARMTSYMNPGLTIRLTAAGKSKDWKSKDGIKEYLAMRLETLKATPFSKKYVYHNSGTLEMILAFTDVEGSQVEFFTNTVRNVEDGVHADDVYKALYDSLKPFVKSKAKPKKKGKRGGGGDGGGMPFTPSDLRDGLLGLVNYKIDAPQFDSQTKEKLVDGRVKGACYAEAIGVFNTFWKDNNKLARDLIDRATQLRSKTADFLKDKKLVKNVKAATNAISAKLARVEGNAPVEKRELFLVEGDSAGGGAKRSRDRKFQAVYPLRGKPLNVMEAQKDKVNSNKEIMGLLAALGVKMDGKNAGAIQYGKVICMADPDVDGDHINTLLLGALYKYTPHLFQQGCIYVVKAPLYKAKYKGETYFGMTKESLYKQTSTKNLDITYIKGWGEINAEDLGVAMHPSKRRLYRVVPSDKKGKAEFELLLGKRPEYRKKLLGVQ